MEIKVLGPGCAKCEKTEEIVKQAVEELGVEARIEKVTDTMDIARHGVLGTPAVCCELVQAVSNQFQHKTVCLDQSLVVQGP